MNTGRRIEIRGTVQGVGFRPWVYRMARRSGVVGRVRNDARGVTIEAFAPEEILERFVQELKSNPPPSARIVELRAAPIPVQDLDGFAIESSGASGDKALSIPPDLATCVDCRAEVMDPKDRRFGYAFTNCTVCGPRFTIATGIPYDRSATTMTAFPMCDACRREYDDIEDRRFHAQPNACPQCGPSLDLVRSDGTPCSTDNPLAEAAELLMSGAIVAVKGLGGFHLSCDAWNEAAVLRLRQRKHRDEKPFAVMVANLDAAHAIAEIDPEEEALLSSAERPIVLVRARADSSLAAAVNPDTPLLGLFLPYTPLHHLLLAAAGRPLVMTSANVAEEPICRDNDEAQHRLGGNRRRDSPARSRHRDALRRLGRESRRRRADDPAPFTGFRPATLPFGKASFASGSRLRRAPQEHLLHRDWRQRVLWTAYRRSRIARGPRVLRRVHRQNGNDSLGASRSRRP